MKISTRIGYYVKEGFFSMLKNGMMSIASVGVLIACLLIMGSFFLVSSNIQAILTEIKDQNEIMVFIEADTSDIGIEQLGEKIKALENVRSVEFVSRDTMFEEYISTVPDGEELFKGIPENPLRDAYKVHLVDISLIEEALEDISEMPLVGNVRGQRDVSENLVRLQNILNVVMIWFMAILAGISLFIISNSIRSGMFARRKEINIMKHVGATDWFIIWPFIIEGMFIGLISGILSFVAQMYIYNYILNYVLKNIEILTLVPFANFAPMLLYVFLGAGILVGVISSSWSVRKYLHV